MAGSICSVVSHRGMSELGPGASLAQVALSRRLTASGNVCISSHPDARTTFPMLALSKYTLRLGGTGAWVPTTN